MESRIYYRVKNCLLLDPVLSQLNPVHIRARYFAKFFYAFFHEQLGNLTPSSPLTLST